jgi:NADH-quinone oxidoreductase subunit J
VTGIVLFWMLSVLALAGALIVVLTREVMRLALGLGVFLLAVAGFFALFGFEFLALAEIFVYVGGVLVLVLFAIMLVHRSTPDRPELESRHDSLAAIACLGVGALVAMMARPIATPLAAARRASVDALGKVMLGQLLPQFEVAGLLLLAALVAVVSVSGRDRS